MTAIPHRSPGAGPVVLSGEDVARLLPMNTCIAAVEEAMRLHGLALAPDPVVAGVYFGSGSFHIKAGVLPLARSWFAAKVNANFPENPSLHGLPTIQGVLVLFDADRGAPVAVMDSAELTRRRTAAATAVAAHLLARDDAATLTILGCGAQAGPHLEAMAHVRRLQRVYACDLNGDRARAFAENATLTIGVPVVAVVSPGEVTRISDIIVTCTTSTTPVLGTEAVSPGTFIGAVGADNPHKHEIAPDLLRRACIVTDVTEQAAVMGDLHHAISAGVLGRDAVRAELGEVVAGRKPGRRSPEEIVVFDSTGMALQDVAAAVAVYRKALALS